MSRAPLPLSLPKTDDPLSQRVAEAIVRAIRQGRLRPGERLPGTRALAGTLDVHRNTVIAAFAELEGRGWVRSAPSSGTYVAEDLPARAARAPTPAQAPPLPPPPAWLPSPATPPPPGALVLAGGRPDLRHLPTDALARAWRRGLRRHAATLMDYGDPRGTPRLREALLGWLAEHKGLAGRPDSLLISRGAQQGLYLLAQTLLRPGDRVAVEAWGYPPAWGALRSAGATLCPIPVDGDGLDPEALERAHAEAPVRAVYLTPHHQFPTMAVLSAGRRERLLRWAARERVVLIEDDYDHEFHYQGRPVPPLATEDPGGLVAYVGTLSKVLAPGLRTGFVVASPALIERLAALRTLVDRQGDAPMENALAELIADGELQRHMGRMRRLYQARRDALADALRRELGAHLDFSLPPGGLAIWARTRCDAPAWAERARAAGVVVVPGLPYHLPGTDRAHLRLGFGGLDEAALAEAARRLARAVV